ncbi:related to SEC66 - ER protein-translocation complex chain [Melanopsichium pennsylvanicum]|uniref:Related to SEC66 - ER protein-translocation complex chain n=2 Tax=Melanopsichium pennsylvanicum TaxID=63383 RepID=A0AAJ4XKM6_9BASI|nr:related to SEC66-ER protein-translocation complex chain [Melanopsichium pennsylvanicum 4]SNX83875.1 related to SEC66 - ER protein-translocation complex chain [Melanopsichium pennsylvanicum]
MALSIFVPIGYVATLVVSMLVFSRIYRRRSALKLAKSYQPWFQEGHEARDIYQTLVAADPPASEVVLKAALLNRAMTDVRRIMRMRDDKQALGTLLQKGSIGDETMARFTLAEKELEAEILDVVSEANTFREGWGQLIFPTASEMVAHLKHKEIYYEIQRQRAVEVKKLEDEGRPVPKSTVELPPLVTPPGTKIEIQGGAQGGPAGGMQQGAMVANGGQAPNGPGIQLPMTGSGEDARVMLPNGQQIHPAQLAALMQGPLPPNLPPQQAALLMQARAQLQALQEQATAQQAQQQQQQEEKPSVGASVAGYEKKKKDAAASSAAKVATVEDDEDA